MTEPDSGTIRRIRPEIEKGTGIAVVLRGLFVHRSLVREMTRREMTDVHAGQLAGALWLLVHPLLQFIVYAFLFTVVFQVRIANRGPSDYLVYLFAGLAPWLLTQDVLARASSVFPANAPIVKKVMFPLEVLVAKTALSSIIVQSILMICSIGYIFVVRASMEASYLLIPFLFAMHLSILWGFALLLSSITPFFRDISEFVRVFLTINIYLMPILYLPDMIPGPLRIILAINPFSHLIWCYQDVLYFNAISHPWSWLIVALFATAALAFGSYAFSRLRHYLTSVL